jgi:ribosomal-protein-alanine N-acetyltransferase
MNPFYHHVLALLASERQRRAAVPLTHVLEGPQVRLRSWDVKDGPAYTGLRGLSATALRPWEPAWPADALTPGFYMAQWRRLNRRWMQDREYSFFIFARMDNGGEDGQEGALLGGVTLTDVRRNVSQSATLGYWMGIPYVGQGYMREALGLILEFAFGPAGLHRLEASCMPENTRSLDLLRKNGMREIGLSKSYMQIDGRWRDHLIFERDANS